MQIAGEIEKRRCKPEMNVSDDTKSTRIAYRLRYRRADARDEEWHLTPVKPTQFA